MENLHYEAKIIVWPAMGY